MKELKKREAAAAEFENVIPSDWQEEPEQSLVVDGNSPTASVHMDEARSDSVASGSLEQDGPVTPAECELDTEVQQLRALIRILEEDFESIKETARALWKKKQVTFDLLWYFFQEGSHVTFVEGRSGLTCAGKVRRRTIPCADYRSSLPTIFAHLHHPLCLYPEQSCRHSQSPIGPTFRFKLVISIIMDQLCSTPCLHCTVLALSC